jgi:acetyltransferase-like isoleucine patch superfamily enzyme
MKTQIGGGGGQGTLRGRRTQRRADSRRRSELKQRVTDVLIGPDVVGASTVQFGGRNMVGRATKFADQISVGYATTIGEHCYLSGPASLGNYCQLGPFAMLFGQDHPVRHPTLFSTPRDLAAGLPQPAMLRDPIEIAHGVWVGANSVVLKGVTIGNGAVIGAGSVVSRDVPAYAIAVGNPAQVIDYRFDEEIQDLVERTRWWTMSEERHEVFRGVLSVDCREQPELAKQLLVRVLADLGDTT